MTRHLQISLSAGNIERPLVQLFAHSYTSNEQVRWARNDRRESTPGTVGVQCRSGTYDSSSHL